jgi:GH25 family lysozyme M1 (1,4-beta-N-acetylmuramidase)
MVICVDLNRYKKDFNFARFKAGGGLGVILEATENSKLQDIRYVEFREGAKDAGLAVATYHVFRSNDPIKQADYYYNFARPEIGERMVCKFVDNMATINNMMIFFQRLQTKGKNLQLTVYGGNVLNNKLGLNANQWLADNTSLWVGSGETETPVWPEKIWPQWSLWQYSETGRVPGYNFDISVNKFNGSDDEFLMWMGPAAIVMAPDIRDYK